MNPLKNGILERVGCRRLCVVSHGSFFVGFDTKQETILGMKANQISSTSASFGKK